MRLPVADDDRVPVFPLAGLLRLLARADAGHALVVVVEDHDALQALDALVVVDAAVALDGADLAVVPAVLAGLAAGVDALEPGEQVVLAEHGQAGAERAEVAAVELVHEQAQAEQDHGVEHERPAAHEEQGDGGLERFHFGQAFGQAQGVAGAQQQAEQDEVFELLQAPVVALGDFPLPDPQALGDPAEDFLQGAEGAEPAAEQAAAPEEQADEGEAPEDEDQRVHQENADIEAVPQGLQQGEDIHHRQLALGVEPDEYQGEQQETGAKKVKAAAVRADAMLEDEQAAEQDQRADQQGDLPPAFLPHAQPDGHRLGRGDGLLDIEQLLVELERPAEVGMAFHQMIAPQADVQLQGGGLGRVEGGVALDAEDMRIHIAQRRGEHLQHLAVIEVQVVQFDGLVVLHQQQTAGRGGGGEIGRDMPIQAAGQHQQRLLAGLQLLVELLPTGRVEQVAAHARGVEVGEMQFAEGAVVVRLLELGVVAQRMPQLGFDFLAAQQPALHITLVEQMLPVHGLVQLAFRRGQRSAGETVEQLPGNAHGCLQHGLIEDDHRHRGLADAVELGGRLAVRAVRTATADDDRPADGVLPVLLDEVQQRLHPQAIEKHRLMVFEHPHPGQHALQVHADQQADGLAGKTLEAGVVAGLEGVAEQFVELVDAVDRRRLLLGFDPRGLREQLQDLLLQPLGGQRLAEQRAHQQEHPQAGEAAEAGWHGAPRRYCPYRAMLSSAPADAMRLAGSLAATSVVETRACASVWASCARSSVFSRRRSSLDAIAALILEGGAWQRNSPCNPNIPSAFAGAATGIARRAHWPAAMAPTAPCTRPRCSARIGT
ncbi:hypothetical protein D3C84_366600 [compost metagenome]